MTNDDRVLVLMPTTKDGERTHHALTQAGFAGLVCSQMDELCREIARGAGAALLTEESVVGDRDSRLRKALDEQPTWSDLPLVVLAAEGRGGRIRESMNALLVERPVKIRSLLSVVRAALRSRRHQYAVRDHLETIRREREQLRVTLSSIGDAVISTDADGRITFMNGVAEALTRWTPAEAAGRPLSDIFRIVNEQTREPAENPALRALREGTVVGLANHTVLIAKDATERPIDDTAAPIRDGADAPTGAVLVFRDVTERRRAEEARARLAAIVESSDDAIISKSLDGTIRSWNAGAVRIFGYTAAEAVGQSITLIIPPERLDEERQILEQLHRGERIEHFETVRIAKGGRQVHISLTVSPIRNADGHVVGASKIARDVTARKRLDDALRESEQRFRALVTATADVVYRMNPDWTEMRYLDGRAFIADANEPTRSWLKTYIPPEEQSHVMAVIADAIRARKPFELEHRILRADGTVGWTFSRAIPVLDPAGELVEWFGAATDVTRRKQAEEELARVTGESERRKRLYETILSATPDFVYVFSLDHKVLYANDSLVAMWGAGDPVGKTFLEIGYEPWHAEMHCREIDEVRSTKQPIRGEVPFIGTNGRRMYDYIFVPVFGANGEVEAVAGTTRDVTDRNAMEEELRDTDRKKDEFIALLAHELRNPLAPIRNGLQVMRLAEDENTRDQVRTMMERQLSHMVRLIDDLLDVSRINRSKMELRRSRILLADAISSAVETARPAIDAEGHDLSVTLPGSRVYLDADLTRLAQVFGNLLTNSAKYTPRGGKIWLSAQRSGQNVVVSVRDTGIGIPADALPKIFDMFSQVDRTIERSTGGLGIGLALVKGLVEMHGGTVTAASDGEGNGSVFTVILPVLEGYTEPVAVTPSRAADLHSHWRILVVDDNRDGADSLAMMLRLLGHDIETAHDGAKAVEQAEQFRPEMILMDVGMPVLNGLEATRRIRAQPWGKGISIIAVTGWGQTNDRERSREAGCDGHLVKPIELEDLERLLERLRNAGQ